LKYVDPPEELVPTEDDLGRMVEVADFPYQKEWFRLVEINREFGFATTKNLGGQSRAFKLEAVMLHRNENIRDSEFDLSFLFKKRKKVKK